MGDYRTEQEEFWAGQFGAGYIERNNMEPAFVAANLALFSRILEATQNVRSVLELGANIGLNLAAIGQLLPQAQMDGVEINAEAAVRMGRLPRVAAHNCSILDFSPTSTWDLVFTQGVLIHLAPEVLPEVYDLMFRCSQRYLLVNEYYNPTPVAIPYRGHDNRLFKRDFAGEILDAYPQLRLVDYGFRYRRDPNFPQDDCTWFLMEKIPPNSLR